MTDLLAPTHAKVAVVVLTWNGVEDTLACLASLAQSDWPNLEVIVADNGSADGTPAAVRGAGTASLVIENEDNLGFAAGNNAGIAAALERGADLVFVLNNDTIVPAATIGELVRALEESPRAGACSAVLTYADAPRRIWFAGSPFDPSRGRAGRASRYETGAALPSYPFAIDRVVGAAMLVRREAIEEVGLLAEELFYLYEDVEWSLRMRGAGWTVLLVPNARVAHRVASSQNGQPVSPTTAYYGTRNDLELGRRYGTARGPRALRRDAGCCLVHLAQVRRARPGQRLACLRATLAGANDFRRGRLGRRG